MKRLNSKNSAGFSIIELMVAMVVMLLALGIVSMLLSRAMSVKARESRTADALTTAQAAIGVMSREIANSGFGMYDNSLSQTADNGIVSADSTTNQIRVRANHENTGVETDPNAPAWQLNAAGEDVTYFFDPTTQSIVRYDANALGPGIGQTSVVVNKISAVEFEYYDYSGPNSAPTGPNTAPTANTGRVRIIVTVNLDPVVGQPDNQQVTFASEVTLRNNTYMLQQY